MGAAGLSPAADSIPDLTPAEIECAQLDGHYPYTEQDVVTKTWEYFKQKQIKDHAGVKPLHYYKEWDTKNRTEAQLLESGDGNCYANAEFFVKTPRIHIGGVKYQQVKMTGGILDNGTPPPRANASRTCCEFKGCGNEGGQYGPFADTPFP